ncbi:hypothetical protein VCRA2116O29_30069 [Vibrio crassostreae]|nr:hypothetical protein VCRA2110O182_120013 [Vibrio crassostreae]CAK2234694.1 hypothetical protein VCRA2111O408_110012 [Vibrio crassostreae]CAK2275418.1 hypothetical protein VCRA211O406_100107 [Vibrio crassostreae]CAK2483983.1 hypothetical protein VCRA2116O29_30069 [Vibrio crassostreae]CAK2489923.1 hypothetical protein VCRA2113O415_30007 [Vibrio crassostreae]
MLFKNYRSQFDTKNPQQSASSKASKVLNKTTTYSTFEAYLTL